MIVGNNLEYYLQKLNSSNLINCTRAVSDVLRESALDADLLCFINLHAKNVSLKEQLTLYAKTKKFSPDPRVSLPFIYSVLYLVDSGKLSAEDLISSVYPGFDAFDSYPLFFGTLGTEIKSAIELADLKQPVLDIQNGEDTPLDEFDAFLAKIEESDVDEKDKKNLSDFVVALQNSLDGDDDALTKSLYYGLLSVAKKSGISEETLSGIKSRLLEKGVAE